MTKKIDTIIIGQGLAGSLLAFELEKKSKGIRMVAKSMICGVSSLDDPTKI